MLRVRTFISLACYCLLLFLVFDFIYSTFLFVEVRYTPFRTYDARYSHGLMPNFHGFDIWGGHRYEYSTNSLGFRDGAARSVSQKGAAHRVLLIGDSFTEGLGVPFEETFAGLLYRAGQEQSNKVEFLNAAVVSYSPVLYYKKIKSLLADGLTFDEVVVFLDLSDVQDEAESYFCFDDNPEYDVHKVGCPPAGTPTQPVQVLQQVPVPPPTFRGKLKAHFVVTARSLANFNSRINSIRGLHKQFAIRTNSRSNWTLPAFDVSNRFKPLSVEDAIARSRKNMQALANLLAMHRIPLTIAVYPWPQQLEFNDRNSRQSVIWREFCSTNCKSFIDLFPVFFAFKDTHRDWYERLFIEGDIHYSAAGNRLVFQAVAGRLLNDPMGKSKVDTGSATRRSAQ